MIVLAYVVAHDRPAVTNSLAQTIPAFVANKKHAAFVIVTVVALNDRVAAVPSTALCKVRSISGVYFDRVSCETGHRSS
jgi:hypothetical protein